MKWHSIKVNVRFSLINSLRYLTFSSVRAVFGRPLPGFRSVADPRSLTSLLLSLSKPSNPFPEILQQLFCIQNQVFDIFDICYYLVTFLIHAYLTQTVQVSKLLDGEKILAKILTLWVGRNNVTDDRHRRTAHAIRRT